MNSHTMETKTSEPTIDAQTETLTSGAFAARTGPSEPPLLVGRVEAARLCGVSPASWDRLSAAGKNPGSLKLGGRVLWRRTDLLRWIAFDCPNRKAFETLISGD